jgi:hypothetical protein
MMECEMIRYRLASPNAMTFEEKSDTEKAAWEALTAMARKHYPEPDRVWFMTKSHIHEPYYLSPEARAVDRMRSVSYTGTLMVAVGRIDDVFPGS